MKNNEFDDDFDFGLGKIGTRTRTIDFETIVNTPQINYNDEVINNWSSQDFTDFDNFLKSSKKEGKYLNFIDFPKWVFVKAQIRENEDFRKGKENIIKKSNIFNIAFVLLVINMAFVLHTFLPLSLLIVSACVFYYYNVIVKGQTRRAYSFVKSVLDRMEPYSDKPIKLCK